MNQTLTKNGFMLGAFAVVTTALIALTFYATAPRIEHQQKQKLLSVLNEVVPSDLHTNALYADCAEVVSPLLGNLEPHLIYRARTGDTPQALVVEATAPNGYSGNIHMVIGVDTSMQVLGVRVIEHKETPGLGDKIELAISDWITQFSGKVFNEESLNSWQVKKDGGEFDQFTGATITPRAVVGAVKNALLFVKSEQASLFSAPNVCQSSQASQQGES
jgi:electron transport complex protein RnfG